MIKVHFVQAIPDEAITLTRFAKESKAVWGYPSEWMDVWEEELAISPQQIQEETVYKMLDENHRLLGYYRLKREGERSTINGFWIHPSRKGQGLGKQLFNHLVESAKQLGINVIEWELDPNAASFYIRMGGKIVGEKVYLLIQTERRLPLFKYALE